MRVRENEMYRAIYCGLCRSMGHHTGCTSRLTLSYDFVFLAVFRAALTGEKFILEPHRCALHPLKSRIMVQDCETLAYCARAAALLTHAKLHDDLQDERGCRRAAAALLRPSAASMRRRALCSDAERRQEERITAALSRLAELERADSDSIDETAACFGELLGEIFCAGLTGISARIAAEAGQAVGRYIYVADAADDAFQDAQKGRYNPILRRYGTDIFHPIASGEKKGRLREEIAGQLYTAALCSLTSFERTVELIDFSACQTEVEGILKNTAYLGIPAQLRRILMPPAPITRKDAHAGEGL